MSFTAYVIKGGATMIFAINGSVERIQRDSVIISTASGLDYEIFITQFDLANMSTGASCKLFINEIRL